MPDTATGIGRAVAIGFAGRGDKVAVGDIHEEAGTRDADVEKLVGATVERSAGSTVRVGGVRVRADDDEGASGCT